jgi:hypothetical protein
VLRLRFLWLFAVAGCSAFGPTDDERTTPGYTQATFTLSTGFVISAEVNPLPAGGLGDACTNITADTTYTADKRALGYNAHILDAKSVPTACSALDIYLPPGPIEGGTMEARCRWGHEVVDYPYECNIILLDVGAGGTVGSSGVTLGRLDFKSNRYESTLLDRGQPVALPFHGVQSGHLRLLMYQWQCLEGPSCPRSEASGPSPL